MPYTYITSKTSPNQTPAGSVKRFFGRARTVDSITIHHWGAFGQTFDAVANYLCRVGGKSSAHYVVEDGKVACLVDPANAAWHSGTSKGNATSVGIECRPEATDGDYSTVAELVRELRGVYGDIPLVPHSSWKATACPGKWDLVRLDRLARSGAAAAPAPAAPAPAPAPTPTVPGYRDVRDLQKAVGATPDNWWGADTDKRMDAVRSAARFHGGSFPYGVAYLQEIVGTKADGRWGPLSSAAHDRKVAQIQRLLGVGSDGIWGAVTEAAYLAARAGARKP